MVISANLTAIFVLLLFFYVAKTETLDFIRTFKGKKLTLGLENTSLKQAHLEQQWATNKTRKMSVLLYIFNVYVLSCVNNIAY